MCYQAHQLGEMEYQHGRIAGKLTIFDGLTHLLMWH